MRRVPCVIAAALLLMAVPVRGDDEAAKAQLFATIDRVDYEPSSLGVNRLVISLSALDLYGKRIPDIKPKVTVNGSKLDDAYALGTYGATQSDTAIIVLIQASPEFGDALGAITSSLETEVLSKLNDHNQVAILQYGDSVSSGKLVSAKAARSKLADVTADTSPSDPALLDSVDRALGLLRKAKAPIEGAPLRKMIVIIGDGRDRSGDRDRVTRLGQRADKEGVRIHSFGWAPTKNRRPLLLLGELSKRSFGTFRFLRAAGAESWTVQLQLLHEEIAQQYVLTYFVPADNDLSGKKVKVALVGRVETASQNEVKIPELSCNGEACAGYCTDAGCAIRTAGGGRGVLGWVLLIGGIGAGAIVLLGLVGFALSKRQQPIALPAGFVPPPGFVKPPSKPPKAAKSKPPKGVVVPVVAPILTGPSLMFIAGPRAGQRVYLRNGFIVGKAPTSDLVIDDGYTSTQHAQIGLDDKGNCNLYDRNSTNGTFVNGVRVTEALLYHGQSVRFGSTELQYLAQ